MRILLIGKNGQIGWELARQLADMGEIVAPGREDLDLSRADSIRQTVEQVKPGLIINAAAYTAVDRAEEEKDLAMAVNGTAPGILAEAAKKAGAGLIHYSTDYVFDGDKTDGPYLEDAPTNPKNVYGQTKLAGEHAIQKVLHPHIILRTSGVYGSRGKNFMLTILRLAREGKELKIVNDQVNAPTWCGAIAQATKRILVSLSDPSPVKLLERMHPVSGIYHLSCQGETNWYEFAKAILQISKCDHPASKLIPIPTSEYSTPAARPAYSVLSNAKLTRVLGIEMPRWEDGLKMCIENQTAV